MATEFIFTHPIIKTIATGLTGFTIGVASVAGLHSFTGGTLLTNTQTEVSSYVDNVQSNINGLSSYLQNNNTVNAEVIEKYQQALDKANANLTELKEHITTSDSSLEAELVALQERYDELQASVDAQVQAQVDEVIAKANIQIDAANTASETTYNNVHAKLGSGNINQEVQTIKNANPALAVKDEDLQVESIIDIVGLQVVSIEDLGTEEIGQGYKVEHYIKKVTFNDGKTKVVAVNSGTNRVGYVNTSETTNTYSWNSIVDTHLGTEHRAVLEEYLANQQ